MPSTPFARSGRSKAATARTRLSCAHRCVLTALALLVLPRPAMADAAKQDDVAASRGLLGQADPMPDMPTGEPGRNLSVSFGATYWHGDFGTPADTEIASGLLSVRYRADDLRFSATLPLMRIDGDARVFTGIDGTPLIVSSDRGAPGHRRDGLGDLTLGASYALPALRSLGLELELQGRLKLPTASGSSGLSTGRTDASFGVDLYRPVGRVTPYASVRYRVFGDPRGQTVTDGFSLTAGAIVNVTGRTYGVVSYSFAKATNRLIGDAHQLLAAVSTPVSDRLRLTVLGSAGLSDGAPALSVGASIGYLF